LNCHKKNKKRKRNFNPIDFSFCVFLRLFVAIFFLVLEFRFPLLMTGFRKIDVRFEKNCRIMAQTFFGSLLLTKF
jgi:hypothetical protein